MSRQSKKEKDYLILQELKQMLKIHIEKKSTQENLVKGIMKYYAAAQKKRGKVMTKTESH